MKYIQFINELEYIQNIFSIIANSCITILGFIFVLLVYLLSSLRDKFTEPIAYYKNINENTYKEKSEEVNAGDLTIKLSQFVYAFIFVSFVVISFLLGTSLIILAKNGIDLVGALIILILGMSIIYSISYFQKKTMKMNELWRIHVDGKWKNRIYNIIINLIITISILINISIYLTNLISSLLIIQIIIALMFTYLIIFVYFLIQNISLVYIISIDYSRLKNSIYIFNDELIKIKSKEIGIEYKHEDTDLEIGKWKMFEIDSMKVPPSINESELEKVIKQLKS